MAGFNTLSNLAAVKIEGTEITSLNVALTIMFSICYIAVAAIGIRTYYKCEKLRGVTKWDNIKMLLSHTMAIAIATPAIFVALKMSGEKVGATMAILFGIMGLVASATSLAMTKVDSCDTLTSKDTKNYLIIGMTVSIIIMISGMYLIAQ